MPTAKEERSRFWFCNFDGPEEFVRQKCVELSQCIDVVAMLAAFHKGDKTENPHCHFVIELTSEPQKQSFAVRTKKLFGVIKGGYSIQKWDAKRGAGACSYLFHEDGAPIIVNKGFSDEDIADARSANDAVQRVVALNKQRASNKFVDRALEHFPDGADAFELLKFMMTLCKDGQLYWPGTYRAKQLIEEVQIRMAPSVGDIASHFYNKMFS